MLFGVHMHQPVDNFDFVIEKAIVQCYQPFFDTLKEFDFPLALHCSGWLFEKIKERYPKLFETIASLYRRGQIEFFTGGFYEPILSTIPSEDRITQIRKHKDFLQREFGAKARGLWLAERVWDYAIVKDLVNCGIEYVIVDDNHLLKAGIQEIDGYYYTEEEEKIALFPISQELRYAIPFKEIDEVKRVNRLVHFDDLEKFGLWPYTYEWVYEKGWLKRFFSSFQSIHFYDYFSKEESLGLAYIKDTSYSEMEEWSGGVFKNFFRKYSESNHLHKRMLQISKERKSEALYKLQANDVYWHGIFGGLYLPNLRDNAYRYLIEAEEKKEGRVVEDFDMDGKKELSFYEKDFIYIFNHKGEIIELDDRKRRFNFLNTLQRRKEAYHKELFEPSEHVGVDTIHHLKFGIDEKIKEALIYDNSHRYGFVDYFLDDASFFHYKRAELKNFFDENFTFQIKEELHFQAPSLVKSFSIKNNTLNFKIKNSSPFLYACECSFHFANEIFIDSKPFEEGVIIGGELIIYDPFTNKTLSLQTSAQKIYATAIHSVNKSEKGFELILQCFSFLFLFEQGEIEGEMKIS